RRGQVDCQRAADEHRSHQANHAPQVETEPVLLLARVGFLVFSRRPGLIPPALARCRVVKSQHCYKHGGYAVERGQEFDEHLSPRGGWVPGQLTPQPSGPHWQANSRLLSAGDRPAFTTASTTAWMSSP